MTTLPPQIQQLPAFDGPFDARRLSADGCDVLFASYPAGTAIADHEHETDNVGVITAGELILIVEGRESRHGVGDWYHVSPGQVHAARFEIPTAEIEFWFTPPAQPSASAPR
ncbi:MAG: cupin domain-containing protein [Ilumatobacteraceae bacterium]